MKTTNKKTVKSVLLTKTQKKTKNNLTGYLNFTGKYYPIKDATEGMIFQVTDKDLANAIGHNENPNQCVLACAIRRTYGDAVIHRTRAYVLRTINGEVYAYRYQLASKSKKAVRVYDDTGIFPEGVYLLSAISPARKLEVMRGDLRNRASKNIVKNRTRSRGNYKRLQTAAV